MKKLWHWITGAAGAAGIAVGTLGDSLPSKARGAATVIGSVALLVTRLDQLFKPKATLGEVPEEKTPADRPRR